MKRKHYYQVHQNKKPKTPTSAAQVKQMWKSIGQIVRIMEKALDLKREQLRIQFIPRYSSDVENAVRHDGKMVIIPNPSFDFDKGTIDKFENMQKDIMNQMGISSKIVCSDNWKSDKCNCQYAEIQEKSVIVRKCLACKQM